MVKHNNVIPNVHFRKGWERFVSTWFDQAAQKRSRRIKRARKAARIFPRPVKGLLRPAVHSPTIRYNMKVREGRGFTLQELKQAGINRREALTIGISIDHRRTNLSEESLRENVQRLKTYMSKLVLFPTHSQWKRTQRQQKRAKRLKKKTLKPQEKRPIVPQLKGPILPIKARKDKIEIRTITDNERKGKGAFFALRRARADARLVGIRKKKAQEVAAAAAFKKAKAEK